VRIRSILHRKGDDVVTIAAEASLADASRLLTEHRIGALLVSTDRRSIEGILSERDVARAIAVHGPDVVDVQVADVMTTAVRTCSPHSTVDELMAAMTDHRIRHLPVVEETTGALLGIVSIGDVVKHRLSELEQETQTLHDYIELGR
jgi:CBS domain-containing protein